MLHSARDERGRVCNKLQGLNLNAQSAVVGRDLDEGERHFEHLLAHDVSADKKRLLQAFRLHLEQLGNEGNSCAGDGRRARINPPLVRSAWQRGSLRDEEGGAPEAYHQDSQHKAGPCEWCRPALDPRTVCTKCARHIRFRVTTNDASCLGGEVQYNTLVAKRALPR